MSKLILSCEDYDFSALAEGFSGEFESDADLSAEIIICGEDEIQRLNRELRSVDKVTDVLSFPSLDGILGRFLKKENFPLDLDDGGNIFIGSIAICLRQAERQADEYGNSIKREINYLAAHGICHLLGYDHIEDGDRAEMRKKEERVLAKINLKRD